MPEASPENSYPTREKIIRAYEQGVLMGAKLEESSNNSEIGTSPQEKGAFELGFEKGNEILKEHPVMSARNLAAGRAVGAYINSRRKAN